MGNRSDYLRYWAAGLEPHPLDAVRIPVVIADVDLQMGNVAFPCVGLVCRNPEMMISAHAPAYFIAPASSHELTDRNGCPDSARDGISGEYR